jgi:hypothetical protein
LRTYLPVSLHMLRGDTYSGFLTNASVSGFRIKLDQGLTIGRFLVVDLPNFTQYPGWVAWADTGEFGFEVANALPQEIIDYIQAAAAKM